MSIKVDFLMVYLDKFIEIMSFSNIANSSSILGLIVTFVTFYLVYNIRKRFLFRVTIDKNRETLNNMSSEISSLLVNFENNISEIDEKLKIIEVTLRNLIKGTDNKNLVKDIKNTMKKIKVYFKSAFFFNKNHKTQKNVREIKIDIVGIIEELKHEKQNIEVGN